MNKIALVLILFSYSNLHAVKGKSEIRKKIFEKQASSIRTGKSREVNGPNFIRRYHNRVHILTDALRARLHPFARHNAAAVCMITVPKVGIGSGFLISDVATDGTAFIVSNSHVINADSTFKGLSFDFASQGKTISGALKKVVANDHGKDIAMVLVEFDDPHKAALELSPVVFSRAPLKRNAAVYSTNFQDVTSLRNNPAQYGVHNHELSKLNASMRHFKNKTLIALFRASRYLGVKPEVLSLIHI